jgi:pimeloyl-ACP methyl ester carboxylesterase
MTDYVANRGLRIAYDVAGSGDEAVVLLHGLGQRRADWASCGYVDGLADRFRVICVDSLGHGESDSPSDCSVYTRSQRAGDVVAVLDGVGVQRAHLIGYSMGGWLASALLLHAPERLQSLCFGGWDPVGGMAGVRSFVRAKLGVDLDFDAVLGGFREQYPKYTDWITPDREPALRCCFEAVEDVDGVEQALEVNALPVLFWDGQKDPHHHPSRDLATRLPHADFLETPGDHAAAFYDHPDEALLGLRSFLGKGASGWPDPTGR